MLRVIVLFEKRFNQIVFHCLPSCQIFMMNTRINLLGPLRRREIIAWGWCRVRSRRFSPRHRRCAAFPRTTAYGLPAYIPLGKYSLFLFFYQCTTFWARDGMSHEEDILCPGRNVMWRGYLRSPNFFVCQNIWFWFWSKTIYKVPTFHTLLQL